MLVDQPVHEGHIEVLADQRRFVQERHHEVLELRAQEVLHRQAVALLAAPDDLLGQNALEGLAEDVLGGHAAQLLVAGDRADVLHQPVVEQRHADFQRGGHAHLVGLHQHAVGHHEPRVQIRLPVHRVRAVHFALYSRTRANGSNGTCAL
jgi:hypothetical protein